LAGALFLFACRIGIAFAVMRELLLRFCPGRGSVVCRRGDSANSSKALDAKKPIRSVSGGIRNPEGVEGPDAVGEVRVHALVECGGRLKGG